MLNKHGSCKHERRQRRARGLWPRASAEKFPGEEGNEKKLQKIALLSLFHGGNGKNTEK